MLFPWDINAVLHTCKIPLSSITMGKTKELPARQKQVIVDLHKSSKLKNTKAQSVPYKSFTWLKQLEIYQNLDPLSLKYVVWF